MRERDPLVVFGLAFVDLLVVAYAEDALVDLEEELGLGGVVDSDSGPLGFPFFIIYERSGEDSLEFLSDRSTFDHLGQAG